MKTSERLTKFAALQDTYESKLKEPQVRLLLNENILREYLDIFYPPIELQNTKRYYTVKDRVLALLFLAAMYESQGD